MTLTDMPASARVDRYLETHGLLARRPTVVSLTPDASDRRYFRVHLADGPSQVLAVHVGPIDSTTLPFAVVYRLLSAMPVRVPRILDTDDALGIVALDDLGDVTLQMYLADAPAPVRRASYDEAVDIITTIQRRGRDLADPTLLPYQLAFDVEKLGFELRFFRTHFIEGHRAQVLRADVAAALDEELDAIVQALAAEPRVLCHRDYHSRNLMAHGGHLYVIDFQDARLGPDTYDLVSLLRDAYVELPESEVDALIARFREARANTRESAETFRQRFALMTVQRTIKALGTFGFQATARGNPAYLQYVPRSLAVLRATFDGDARFDRLRRALATVIPEVA